MSIIIYINQVVNRFSQLLATFYTKKCLRICSAGVFLFLPSRIFYKQFLQIVWRCLVHKVVEPVCVEERCVAAPYHRRGERRVVVREVVERDLGVDSLVLVAVILVGKRFAVVLGVTGDEHLSAGLVTDDRGACHSADRKKLEPGILFDIVEADRCIARMRDQKLVVKAAHQRMKWVEHLVLINAAELFSERELFYSVVIVERRLSAPADVKGRIDVVL